MNFKFKNTLIWMTLFSILILSAVGITYQSTSSLVEKTIFDHLHTLTVDASIKIEIWLNQQMKILNATADSIDYKKIGNNPETLGPLKMAMKAGHFSDVYIGLPNGQIIDGANWSPPDTYDTRIRPWYLRAIEAGQTAVTKPYVDLTTMELVIALVTPLTDQNAFMGVMSADTVLDVLVENIVNLRIADSGYAFIVEKNGRILVHPNQEHVMKDKFQMLEPNLDWDTEISKNLQHGTIKYIETNQGNDHLLSYQKVKNTDWYICIDIPLSEAYALTQRATVLSAIEIVLISLGGLAFITLLGVGGSVLALLVFNRKFKTTVNQQQEELSGMSEDLQWNISKRKEVETSYQTLFQVANDAILLSHELHYVECNEKASEIFGLSRYNIIGRSMLDLSPDLQPNGESSSEAMNTIFSHAKSGEQQFFEWTFQRNDGTGFPAEVGLKILHWDNEELTLSSIRDISKRVDAEGQLRQAQKMAAMGEMLGAIAHQWRQPLNTLSTYIASIQSAHYNKKLSKAFVDKLVRGADSQIQFMSKTIDDFRHFFKPSKQKALFDLYEAVVSAAKLLEPQLKQNGVNLHMSKPLLKPGLFVLGYQSEFIHVIVNILSNAQDSITEKTLRDQSSMDQAINIVISADQYYASVTITDNGCGIPEELLPKIFTPYFTTKGTAAGTGIGLYMAKMIVEKEMEGILSAENVATGSKFTIKLPLGTVKESHA